MRDSDSNRLDYGPPESPESSGARVAHFIVEFWIGIVAGGAMMPTFAGLIGGVIYFFARDPVAWWIGGGIATFILLALTAHLGLRRKWWGFMTGVLLALVILPFVLMKAGLWQKLTA